MFDWMKLGKVKRSKFGHWLDQQSITQLQIEKAAKLSRGTVSKLCNDDTYTPKISTVHKVMKALKQLGYNVREKDFFDM